MDDMLCKQDPGTIVPVVDFSRCDAKGACVQVCPYDVFEIREIEPADYAALGALSKFRNWVHGGKVAYTPNAGQCRACGLCVTACPERAIKLARASA